MVRFFGTRFFGLRSSLVLAAGLVAVALAATDRLEPTGKWEVQYLHNANNSELTLTVLKFPSASRGVAAGFLIKHGSIPILGSNEKVQPYMLVTSDGGKTWSETPVHSVADDLFFIDDSVGWMVARDGIWKTEESGRSWKRIAELKGMRSISFVNSLHGFAAGEHSRLMETDNGGVTWTQVNLPEAGGAKPAEEEKHKTKPEPTTYTLVTFGDPKTGVVAGTSDTRDIADLEDRSWANPDGYRSYAKTKVTLLITRDGGKTWKVVVNRLYANLTQFSVRSETTSLELFEYRDMDPWASDVYTVDLRSATSRRAFRKGNRAITDVLLAPGGDAWLAGFEPVGKVRSPIPGKVKILHSHDLTDWEETPVDYRAVAHSVMLASAGGENVWAATDTGMILHYHPQ